MKVISLFTVYMLFLTMSYGQQPSLLSINQLENRLANGKDTVYVINFWATWCTPCNKELPAFEKINKEYKSEKVKVLLVSVDFISDLKTRLIPFVKKKQLKTEVYLLNEKEQQTYIDRIDKSWSGSIPATLFVKSGSRKFIESEFTYSELVTVYQQFKSTP